jgi:DNA invertase Pin-like site-specific DNA recombinase
MKYGYIRVTELGPSTEEQTRLLLEYDCDRLFTDITKDGRTSQDALQDLLNLIKENDSLVLSDLARIDRPLKDIIQLLINLTEKKVQFVCLSEQLDSSKYSNKNMLALLAALFNFEQARTKEKNKVGLRSARARGKLGGRPKKLDSAKVAMVRSLHKDKKHSISDICKILKISRATFYRYLK